MEYTKNDTNAISLNIARQVRLILHKFDTGEQIKNHVEKIARERNLPEHIVLVVVSTVPDYL
jgi:hypothetical protein